jgi:hypothetical protein
MTMLPYHTPSDHCYGYATTGNPAIPQYSYIYWPPGDHDTSQPAVTRDSEDRHGPSHLCAANQLIPSAYASATPFLPTHCDSYPALGQTQSDCPEQFAHPPQQYILSVNYAASSESYDSVGYPLCPHHPAKHLPSFPLDDSR